MIDKNIEIELDEFIYMNAKLDQATIQNRLLKEELNFYKEKVNKLQNKLLMDYAETLQNDPNVKYHLIYFF